MEGQRSAPISVATPTLRSIVDEDGAFVWRTLRRLGVAEAEVADVAQEVFLLVHRKLEEYDGRSGMRAWLYGICVRKASDHRRSAYVRRERPVDKLPEMSAPAAQATELERHQARALLEGVLSELDPKKREVFVLFELEELTLAEVAAALGCPLQTAYSRLQAARVAVEASVQRLRRRLS